MIASTFPRFDPSLRFFPSSYQLFPSPQQRRPGSLLWYLATPYSRYPLGLEAAFRDAAKAAAWLLAQGVHTYCPITHTHPIAEAGGADHRDHTVWLALDEHFLKASEGLIVVEMPGWRESKGIAFEIDYMRSRGKPIFSLPWPLSDLDPAEV